MLLGTLLWALGVVAGAAPPTTEEPASSVQIQVDELRAVLAEAEAAVRVLDERRPCQDGRRREIAALVDLAEEQLAVASDPLVAPERKGHALRAIALAHQRGTLVGGVPVCEPSEPPAPEQRELAAGEGRAWRDDPLSLRFDGGRARVLKLSRTQR